MTNRELLEAAAKAAGYADAKYKDMEGWGEVRYGLSEAIWSEQLFEEDGSGYWNPLVDDRQAFQLAIKLRLDIYYETQFVGDETIDVVEVFYNRDPSSGTCKCEMHSLDADPAATVRGCIVRAAAGMGRQLSSVDETGAASTA